MRSNFAASSEPLVPDDPAFPTVPGLDGLKQLLAEIAAELQQLPSEDRPARVALAARFVVSALASWERDRVAGVWRDLDSFETELCALMLAFLRTDSPATSRPMATPSETAQGTR